jgi:hypothetical protein
MLRYIYIGYDYFSSAPGTRSTRVYGAYYIRTAKRFDGRTWSQYDRAFRREAQVNNLQDWSVVRTDLYNFHTSAINRRAGPMHGTVKTDWFNSFDYYLSNWSSFDQFINVIITNFVICQYNL